MKKTRRALRGAVEAASTAAARIGVETIGTAAGSLLKDALKERRRGR
ncbi:hypothetical protein [Sorangium cellulosum]|nr:hypothetical protein [Sorangium cellulosum]